MATQDDSTRPSSGGTATAPAPPANARVVEYEEFIEAQLRKTRSNVRAVDIAGNLMTLAAGGLLFLILAALADQWLVTGGLGFWGRTITFTILAGTAGSYLVLRVLPLVFRRINPLYAADTIERSRPTLKNSLVNFLFLRDSRMSLPPRVYQAIEEQAATHLAKVRVESAVDRTRLIRTGYVLAGIMLVAAVYTLVSPKNLLNSVGRVMMPWADIAPPTRTAIVEIEPGDAQAFRGQQVTVSARIQGLPDEGKVTLLYTTADGQTVDRPVEMSLASDGYKHECVLPPGGASLQQNLEYRIAAGDAESKSYRIEVVAAPTMVVESVQYRYPKYTGLLDQRVQNQGDLRAIEGTEVTLDALANGEIASGNVDFDCDGKPDLTMQPAGERAKATFRLALKPDRQSPEHGSYQLIFKNTAGQQNPQPVRHQIEVTRDLAPEIQIIAPKKDDLDLPANAATTIEVVATDPDFALQAVKLSATVGGKPLADKLLLNEAHSGQFVHRLRFEPAKAGLKPGDVVEYWAEAVDNKEPQPNRTETAKRHLRIVSPDTARNARDQVAQNDSSDDVEQQPSEGDKATGDKPRQGEQKQDTLPEGQDPAKPSEPSKPSESKEQQQPLDDQQPGENGQQKDKGQQGDQGQPSDQGQQGKQEQGSKDGAGGEQGKKPEQAEQQKGGEPSVANDGSNDGDALERILEHQNKQQETKGEQSEQGGSGEKQQQAGEQQGPQGSEENNSAENQGKQPQAPGDEQGAQEQKPDGKEGQDKQGSKQDSQGRNQPQAGKNDMPADPSAQGKQESGAKGEQASGDKGSEDSSQDGEQQRGSDAAKDGQKSAGKQAAERGQDKGDSQSKGKEGADAEAKGSADQKSDGRTNAGDKKPEGASAQKSSEKSDQQSPGAPSDQAQPSEKQGADKQNSERGNDRPRGDGKTPMGEKQGERQGEKPANDARDNTTPADEQHERKPTEGEGAKSKSSPTGAERQKPSDEQKPDAKGGDEQNDKGNSGAGQASQDTKGSPNLNTPRKPVEKRPATSKDDKDPGREEEAQSPATDKRESDSEGEDSGEQSGGGKKGGGQKANKPGTGGPGQNTAADEGAGQSDQSGHGETADRAGNDREADKPTGQSGDKKGEGSASKPAGADAKPDGGKSQGGAPPSDAKGSGTEPGKGTPSGIPPGGLPGSSVPEQAWKPGVDKADEANLEYARKATDLAIRRLRDDLQKGEADAELLKRLGWSRGDLENFVKRWEQMRRDTGTPGERGAQAKRELDDALRSLGLRPRSTTLGNNAARDDQARGYKESRRTRPPAEYAEQSKAYSQGTARGER